MEYLDYYDENDNYLGFETREVVHRDGLWHRTVHNWLYTRDGKVIFQIRKDSGKFYTTSSGHVDKGESLEEAFARETKEEIGLDMKSNSATLIAVMPWKMDKVKKDGSIVKDRAKASVFIAEYAGNCDDFHFDLEEVLGVAFVDAKECLAMFENDLKETTATIITTKDGKNTITLQNVTPEDFLVMPHEDHLTKYGYILKAIIEKTTRK